jgi:acyl carrier protein
MTAAIGRLQQTIDHLQGLLQGFLSQAAAASPPAAPAALSPAGADVVAPMLDVVAEKTGYPVEMLDLSMSLEADLGIDSIKRVEILSAVQGRIAALPDVDTAGMATLDTLQEIIDHLQTLITSATLSGTPAMPEPPPAPAAVATPAAPSPAGTDVVALMLDIVAEKTGYPVEMLDLSMSLEADLGIDSIKRVEILSAVQGRIAALPDVDTAAAATLDTLQEIIDYLQP